MNSSLSIKVGPKELIVDKYKNNIRLEISETYTREAFIEMTGEEPKDSEDLDHRERFLINNKKDLRILITYLTESLNDI